MNIIAWPAQLVNKTMENNNNKGRVMSISTLDVMTPLVLYIAKFVSLKSKN